MSINVHPTKNSQNEANGTFWNMIQLFDPENFGKLAPHHVAGFDQPIPAICYRGQDLKSPFPFGGIATGYFEIGGNGKLRLSSLYNSYVPPMTLSGTVFSLTVNGKTIPLDDEHCDVAVLAHFPVCNFRFAIKDGGPIVWVRAFATVLPGDHEASNTPGVVFEISTDASDAQIQIEIALGHNVEPIVKHRDLPPELNGASRSYFHGNDYRGNFVLAWIDGRDRKGSATDDKATYTLTGAIDAKSRQVVFAWHVPW